MTGTWVILPPIGLTFAAGMSGYRVHGPEAMIKYMKFDRISVESYSRAESGRTETSRTRQAARLSWFMRLISV